MFSKFRLVLGGTLLFILLTAGIGSAVVLAQGPTTTPTAPTTTPATPPAGVTTAPSAVKTLADLFWQALAQRLNTTVDKLQQAVRDAGVDAVTQGVKQGLLTQSQADALQQRLKNAPLGNGFGFFGRRGGAANSAAGVYASVANAGFDAAAKALGMTTNDLTTALRGGATFLSLANDKKVDVTKLRTAIADAEKAALDQAVKDNKITQAQADTAKARLTPDNIDINRRSLGLPFAGGAGQGMMGGMNRFGGFRGRNGQQPNVRPNMPNMPGGGMGGQMPNGRFGRR